MRTPCYRFVALLFFLLTFLRADPLVAWKGAAGMKEALARSLCASSRKLRVPAATTKSGVSLKPNSRPRPQSPSSEADNLGLGESAPSSTIDESTDEPVMPLLASGLDLPVIHNKPPPLKRKRGRPRAGEEKPFLATDFVYDSEKGRWKQVRVPLPPGTPIVPWWEE